MAKLPSAVPAVAFDPSLRPTQEYYDAWELAYDQANWALFEGALPNCMITVQRNPRSMGFLAPERFVRRDGRKTHELGLNPTRLRECATIDALSVMVHGMIHVWQQHFGSPGRNGYHNREFADMSKKLGLHPSDTGEPGDRETGDRMSHVVVDDGPFALFARDLMARGFNIAWTEEAPPPVAPDRTIDGMDDVTPESEGKSGKRVRYVCPYPHEDERGNQFKAWSRAGAELKCSRHDADMVPS